MTSAEIEQENYYLIWEIDAIENFIELIFEIPPEYKTEHFKESRLVHDKLLPILRKNGLGIKDEPLSIYRNELLVPCSFEDETRVRGSLLGVQKDLLDVDWPIMLVPTPE